MASQSSGEQITQQLRNQILSGELAPETRLTHRELADRFSVSFMPVRDALKKLINEGLIVQSRPKTVSVAPLSITDFVDIMEVRSVLEPRALELSAPRLTAGDFEAMRRILAEHDENCSAHETAMVHLEFHRSLYKRAGRTRLLSIVDSVNLHMIRYLLPIWSSRGIGDDWVEDHLYLLGLVEQGKFDEALLKLRTDMDETTLRILKCMSV